ncbi:MAG: 30S ribosomal protein S6 [Candidatus Bathyarchaeia archaeon]
MKKGCYVQEEVWRMERYYESMILISPDEEIGSTKSTLDEIQNLISSSGGEVIEIQEWGMRNLAYKIKKKEKAYYYIIRFRAKPDFIREYERWLELKDSILRYLTIKLEKPIVSAEGGEGVCSTSTA